MTDTPFVPNSLNIKELFTNANSLYQVPPYQRHYKWEDEHVEKLWDDLTGAWEYNPKTNYFLGSIITSKPKQETLYVDIVDGQQRLTTLMILFCVIRDMYPNLNENNEDEFAILSTTIAHAIKSGSDGKDRLRFQPGDSAKSDFMQIVGTPGVTKGLQRPKQSDINGDLPKYKYINSAVFFHSKLQELGKEKVENFINYLFNKVQVIRIDCKDRSFAIKLFQVINTRGLDLSAADLIKSFLLAKTDGQESDINHFITDWTKTEDMADECESNMDEMLNLYLYYKLGENPKKSLYEELEKQFEGKDNSSTEILGDIKRFVENYKTKIYNKEDKVIYSFRYLPWQTHWKSILLTALHNDYPDFDELAKELRRFYYLYWTAGKTLTRIKQTSFKVIKKINSGEPIEQIVKILRDKTIEDEGILNDAISHLVSSSIAGQKWIKPILLLLEYESTDALAYVKWNNTLHLEHVFPRTQESGWKHINEDVKKQYLHSAGNLTLLSGKKNIGASNNPFAQKIDFYKGQKGSSQGTTSFTITQKIISDYEGNAYGKQWTEAAMRDRKKWFLEETAKLLDIEKELADYNKSNLNSPT